MGIIGLGAFGTLVAQYLAPRFPVLAYDPAGVPGQPTAIAGARYAREAEAARCPVVILAMPVNRMEASIRSIRPHLRTGALVLDVGSVKIGPATLMQRGLPDRVDIVATHPLFGPQSAAPGIKGLKVAVCPIRGGRGPAVARFLRALGLEVILTTPEQHDRELAVVQGLTHLIAKVLVQMEPLPTLMTTRSFELLMQGVGMVRDDAPEVLEAIERSNPFAATVRNRFFELAAQLDAEFRSRDDRSLAAVEAKKAG